ncbi:MAG TPA: hypothetical protein VN495_02980 [Candidatus Paceibacterota bacterium]|nr:hypothetical protein [Candidatus Paceibacterota bacterium]
MDTQLSEKELQEQLAARLKQLPKVVQDSIHSADVEQHLRQLADSHKLHLDQWEVLENEVMLTLLGFQQPEELAAELQKDLEIEAATAASLAEDISRIVFAPIRLQLEKELEQSAPADKSGLESHTLEQASMAVPAPVAPAPVPTAPVPATPPPPPPEGRAERAPISASYAAQQPSHERKIIEGDPYREQVA